MFIRCFICFVLCGSFVWGEEESKPEKYTLRYHFRKGEVLRWNVLQSLKLTTSIKGKTETVETISRSTKVWTVLDVEANGNAKFEYQVDDVDMKRFKSIDSKEEKYNSRTDEIIPIAFQNLEGTIGVPLAHLTLGPLGETVKKTSLAEYSGSNRENRIVIPLPKDPIGIGENWIIETPFEIKQEDGTVKKVSARQKFTLEKVQTGLAKIKFVAQILTVLDPKQESQVLDKYSSGQVELDLDAGHIVTQQTLVDKMVVGFQGPADSVHHQSLFKECCCGRKACEICSPNGP